LHLDDASLPWFAPAMAISLVVAVAGGGPVGRALGVGTAVGFLLVLSFGLIASSTLTPQREALEYGIRGSGSCSFSRFWPASLPWYLYPNETAGNVLMFIPLGAVIGWLPPSRGKATLLAVAIALPFAVETTQLLLPVLDRACESADVVDNLMGLAIGLVLGAAAGLVVRQGRHDRPGSVAGDRN
jgi:hypothetical protein